MGGRQAFVESETSDAWVIDMVAELIQEEEQESPPEIPPLGPGQRFGRYEIVAAIGKGGSGEVFSARDPDLGRLVALKFLSGEVLVQGSSATSRLIREAKAP